MARKPTYEELEQRVKELEAEADRHRQVEKNFQESESRFRAFMDNTPAVAYIKNESGQHIYCNKTLLEKFDISPDKFLGTTTRDIFPPAEAEKIETYDEVVKTEGVSVETDDWPDKWQGQTRWWKEIKFPIKLPSGDVLIGGIAFDITKRKQREEEMRMMQFAIDHAMDRIAWIAPDGRFLYANEAACKEMGYTLDEVLSMRVSDIDPTFRIESWAEHYQEVKKRGSTRLETQQVAGDGKIHDVEVFTNVVKFGDLEFMCSFGRDITELRLSERALREQVEFERLIADIAAKLAQTGPERLGETLDSTLRSLGQFLCTDRSFLAQFSGDGKCLKHTNIWAAEGINILPSLFELDIATDLPWLGQQIRMGKVVNAGPGLTALPDEAKELGHWLEHNGITSGVVVPVLVEDRSIGFLGLDTVDQPREYPTALVDRLKIVADMIGSTLRRVQAQKELRESEAKYRSLTNNLNVGVYRNTTGPKGKFIEFNPAFLKIFGYESRDELLSMTVSDIYKDSKKREAFNEKMLKEGYVKDEENVYMRKDGTTFTGAVSAVAVRDHDGRVSYYDGIVEDITKRKEVEKALQESQEDLQRLAGKLISTQEAERRLLAREMHDDISQRLAILAIDAGKLERLCEDSANPIVETLQDMKNRLVDLSSDIHAISRQLHPSILDDLGLFDAVKAECQGFRRREGITVKYEPKAIPYQLPKDAALTLFRIVQEGLRNVAKHAQTQDANVSLFGMDDSIYLSISDDGVGFDYSEARKKPGLGLASMEERVRLIQGEISIKSEPGKGTVIEVRAPLTGS